MFKVCQKWFLEFSKTTYGVTGIQRKWEQEREWNTGTGTCKNHFYSSDSSPVRFTGMYKPSHWYAIVVKLIPLHIASSNKHLCKILYQLMSFVIIM